MKTISIDYGDKRTGLAVSDESGRLAKRFRTLENKEDKVLIAEIQKILLEEKIAMVLVGVPVGLNAISDQTRKTDHFIMALKRTINVPIESVNEMYTSKMAEKNLFDAGKRGTEIRDLVDQEAARIILQEYLDKNVK
jgi:putative Holliday junction resolvase